MRQPLTAESSLRVFETAEEACRIAAAAFAAAARRACESRGRFTVALSGGTTPRPLYQLFATSERDAVPWSGTHFFWSDERFVPRDDAESNVRMAREAFLDAVPLPRENLHAPPPPPGSLDDAARRYERDLLDFFAPDRPVLDWTFLGLGEDGHVASVFPGSTALADPGDHLVLPVVTEAKPPPQRLTMTLGFVNRSREVHVLVFGERKRDILRRVLRGGDELPAERVRASARRSVWWADRLASPDAPLFRDSRSR